VLVLVAIVVAFLGYQRWIERPWTRDGQVRADIVKIAPRVTGYIVEVAVQDNHFVRKGELLFRIDPRSYQLAVDTAQVQLEQAREDVAALVAAVKAAEVMVHQSEAGVVYTQVISTMCDIATGLSAEIAKLGPFGLVSDGSDIPVFAC
jgi:multidrug resistance efflux pump